MPNASARGYLHYLAMRWKSFFPSLFPSFFVSFFGINVQVLLASVLVLVSVTVFASSDYLAEQLKQHTASGMQASRRVESGRSEAVFLAGGSRQ